jgi:DNA-directed RNA polymerase subunit RPC12/RpoP
MDLLLAVEKTANGEKEASAFTLLPFTPRSKRLARPARLGKLWRSRPICRKLRTDGIILREGGAMWFFLFSTGGAKKVQAGQGYFNCPHCGLRQPCILCQVESRSYLYGIIPIGGGEPIGPESYRCLVCDRECVADGHFGYDFGPNAETQTWRCFKCKQPVAYDRFDCPHCGYRLEVGGR